MDYKVFESSEGNVFKYVFTRDDAVAEAVLYKYGDFYERTVICCSTQSGCPVGCKFCGTGNKFIRDLTTNEIVDQIINVLVDKDIYDVSKNGKRFQIMFMSMGEPLLNWTNVESAIRELHIMFPEAELLLSTIAPRTDNYGRLIALSKEIDKVGLQFSIHKSTDVERNKLIPYENKLTLQEIRDFGILWWKETGRHPYLNYCIDGTNNRSGDACMLMNLFSPLVFNFTVRRKKMNLPKLVRNKIPDIIRASGKECEIEILSGEDYIKALDAKLDEEVAEYHESHSLEELADLYEVIFAIAKARGYRPHELTEVLCNKYAERGGFEDRILLKEIKEKKDEQHD